MGSASRPAINVMTETRNLTFQAAGDNSKLFFSILTSRSLPPFPPDPLTTVTIFTPLSSSIQRRFHDDPMPSRPLSVEGPAALGHRSKVDLPLPSGSSQSSERDRQIKRRLPRRVMRASMGIRRGLREHRKVQGKSERSSWRKQYFQLNKNR